MIVGPLPVLSADLLSLLPIAGRSKKELTEIAVQGFGRANMSISMDVARKAAVLAQGLPHYMHLISLYAGFSAVDGGSSEVTREHLRQALSRGVNDANQSIRAAYHQATTSTRRHHLYREVLLACALARVDDLGYFSAPDVRDPLAKVASRRYEIPSFTRHLNDFCGDARGSVLQKGGTERRYRFRFIDPLLKPYVVLRALSEQKIDETTAFAAMTGE